MDSYIDEEDGPVDTELDSELGNVIRGSEAETVVARSRENSSALTAASPPTSIVHGEGEKSEEGKGHTTSADQQNASPAIEIKASDFLFGRTLGEGSYARVVHARLKSMQTDYAMKIQEKAHIKKNKKTSSVLMERDILIKYSHPMVVKLFYCFTDPFYIYLCMDLAPGGELKHIINKFKEAAQAEGKTGTACPLEVVQFYGAEIVEALEYLHSNGIVHRDLKPENVLITAEGHIKLADFGAALLIGAAQKDDNGFDGTALYVSPEVLNGTAITGAADLWALGCVIHQMITGETPFGADTEYLIFERITNFVNGSEPLQWPERISEIGPGETAKNLISRLIRVEPSGRLGAGSDGDDDNGFGHLKGHEFWGEYVDWENLQSMEPPFSPDATMFPSSEELNDGADDEWMIEGEATLIESMPLGVGGGISGNNNADQGVFQMGIGGDAVSSPGDDSREGSSHWTAYLYPGEGQLFSGVMMKRRGLFSKRRRLILTDHPRLFYVDPDTMDMKGEIPWTLEYPVQCSILDDHKFDILSTSTRRVYHLCDMEVGSQVWVDLINAMIEKANDSASNTSPFT